MKKLINTLIVGLTGLTLITSSFAAGNGFGNGNGNAGGIPNGWGNGNGNDPANDIGKGNSFAHFCPPTSVPEPGSTVPLLCGAAIALLSKRKRQIV